MPADCMAEDAFCETCGFRAKQAYVLQDTVFCPTCWDDFGNRRWKGIGSKLSSQRQSDPPKEPT